MKAVETIIVVLITIIAISSIIGLLMWLAMGFRGLDRTARGVEFAIRKDGFARMDDVAEATAAKSRISGMNGDKL